MSLLLVIPITPLSQPNALYVHLSDVFESVFYEVNRDVTCSTEVSVCYGLWKMDIHCAKSVFHSGHRLFYIFRKNM